MNRLKICQDVNDLAGTQGRIDDTVSPVGYQSALIRTVDKCYNDIQIYRKYWHFMRDTVQAPLSTTVNTFTDDNIATVNSVIYEYRTLKPINYDDWLIREWTGTDKPKYYTRNPATGEFSFNPLDASYIVDIHYWTVPDVMTTNGSIPILPTEYHDLIIYKSILSLGGSYLGNYDLAQGYATSYSFMLGEMMRTQLPTKRMKVRPFVI